MTPEAQRIAIAEACGFECVHPMYPGAGKFFHVIKDGRPVSHVFHSPQDAWGNAQEIPDYLADLNAMHEAEKILDNGSLWHGYLNRLWDVVCPQFNQMNGLNAAVGLLLAHATATQRAEAFLRTLNLWVVE